MKYIDADKLKVEIERRKKELFEIDGDTFVDMVDSFNVNPSFVSGYKEA